MCYFNYNYSKKLSCFFLFLTFLLLLPIGNTSSQQKSEDERISNIARGYYQQNIMQQSGSGGDNPEAIQEKFFTGAAANDQFGYSVSTAGDVNGDGYDDIIIGAYKHDAGGSDAGRAYIYFGGAFFNSIADVTLTGAAAVDEFGYAVSTAGDVNSDGYSDVIVGAPNNVVGGVDAGSAYIYFGGANMNSTAELILSGIGANDDFGYSVFTAGDVNGDGYSDVIVGAKYNDAGGNNAGRAYVYFGGSSMNSTVDVILTGIAAGDQFGRSVSTAGDVNADGYSDVIVGATYNDAGGSDAGSAYIYYGGSSMNNTADVVFLGAAVNDIFGNSVSTAGDLNGDGYSDVVVAAYMNDAGGSNAGRAYVYFGGSSMNNTADLTLTGVAAGDELGYSVSTAGDVNGDGYSDIIVGAPYNDAIASSVGRTYVYFGGENMNNAPDITLTGEALQDYFGYSVSTAGDFNGDGYSDLIVGAPYNNAAGSNAGRAYLYTNTLSGADIPDEFFTGEDSYEGRGCSVASAGDVNGDGYSDIIVGAFTSDYTGSAYIYLGGAIINNTADIILTGAAVYDYFGTSVASAGDVNGDGYADVIVGAYGNDAGGASAGRAYIYFGGVTMDSLADVTLTGEAASDNFGRSAASAGDVNGDGYADVIIGAWYNDAGGSNAGRAYIYFGGSSMNNSADVTLTGAAANQYLGGSVSTAGDMNGDGYSDVIVSKTGEVYIYFGGLSMSSTPNLIFSRTDLSGFTVSTAGDVNGDGFSDVIMGADGNGLVDCVFINYGGPNSDNIPDVILTGADINEECNVSAAGDVNMDGYSDVIVGTDVNDYGGANAGRAYIYFGGSNMDNSPDIFLTGESAGDYFGSSVSTAGDVNGDGYQDVVVGAHSNDAGGSGAGRAYLFLSSAPPIKPRVIAVKDVLGDQGGQVRIQWAKSGYDVQGMGRLSDYILQRSDPPGLTGFVWDYIETIPAIHQVKYSYVIPTLIDSSASSSGTFFFRVIARGSNPDEIWISSPISGHSVDNLSPTEVVNFAALPQEENNKLSWKANTEPDLKDYYVYRSFNSTIDPDTMTAVLVTTDTTGLDTSLPPGDMYYFIRARDIHDNFGPLTQIVTPLPLRQINFTALIEGFYDNVSNLMVEDTVDVLLKNTATPYTTIDQGKVKLNTSGNGLVKFRQAANSTNYYLVFKHRNSIETWSKLGQQFTNSEMIYDFITASTKAFGDNMKLKGSKWTIFSGDVNQDGLVDLSDVSLTDIDNLNFATGYTATDVNGDNLVDLSDLSIADINNLNFVSKVTPTFTAKPKLIEVNTLE